jgi:hypothetical protein
MAFSCSLSNKKAKKSESSGFLKNKLFEFDNGRGGGGEEKERYVLHKTRRIAIEIRKSLRKEVQILKLIFDIR